MTALILLVAAIWLFSVLSSVSAVLVLFWRQGRHLWLSWALAITGATVGAMGFFSWTPFGFFPGFGYSRSSDTYEFSVQSNWLFILPLVLGVVAGLLALWRHRCSRASN
jgi:hypothetical protein